MANAKKQNDDPMDFETEMNKIMIPSMIFMIIIMMVGFGVLTVFQTQYIQGIITQEKFLESYKIIAIILGVAIAIPFLLMGYMAIKIKLDRYKFQSEQNILDSFECPIIINPYSVGKYQIQTPSETSPQLSATKGMVNSVRKTRPYQTLVQSLQNGTNIVNLDASDLYATIDTDLNDESFHEQLKEVLGIDEEKEIEVKASLQSNFEDELEDESFSFEDEDFEDEDSEDGDSEDSEDGDSEDSEDGDSEDSEDGDSEDEGLGDLGDGDLGDEFEDPIGFPVLPKKEVSKSNTAIKNRFRKFLKYDLATESENVPIRTQDEDNPKQVITINYDILAKAEILAKVSEGEWRLGFRNVESIKSLDEIEWDEGQWDESMEKWIFEDPLLNIDAICYLIPDEEKKLFFFHQRMSSDGNGVTLRKCYCQFKLVGWLIDNRIPLLVYLSSPLFDQIYNLQLSSATFTDAELIAHTQLTHMAYHENDNLHKAILGLKADKQALLTERSKERQEKIERWLDSQIDPGGAIKKRVNFRPLNLTTIIFSLITAITGFFIGLRVVGSGGGGI